MTSEDLRKLLDYDPATGVFVWKVERRGRGRIIVRTGDVAGNVDVLGYRRIVIDGRRYGAHRLAWLHVHGRWPIAEIDHVNGDRLDNMISNLREATHLQNCANQGIRRNNTSGHKGVTLFRRTGRWQAKIMVERRTRHLGYFDTAAEASSVYQAAAERLHGEFARVA